MVTNDDQGEDPGGDSMVAETKASRKDARAKVDRRVAVRWGGNRLGDRFTPVSGVFLDWYARMFGSAGLNSSEAMLVIHLISYKWDEKAPYPTLATLAKRMGLSPRQVRSTLSRLEKLGLLTREAAPNSPVGANAYNLDPLFKRLETLLDEEEQRAKKNGVTS